MHGKHALLLTLAFAGAIPYGLHAVWSLLAGGGIQVLNLKALERGVRLLLGVSWGPAAVGLGAFQILMRFTLFLVAVLWIFTQTPIRPLAFGAGLLLILPAVAWQGLEEANRETG